MKLVLQVGKTLLISGPASLRLEKGAAEIFGAPLNLKQRVIVRKEKQLPLEIIEEANLEAELGERASYLEIDGPTTPKSWFVAADAFQKSPKARALVIGSTDTGKSTFCTFLVNQSLKLKRNIAVIDADIGQSDLGPPGSLGLSVISKPLIALENSKVDAMIFIGGTSPSSVVEKVIQGILKLEELVSDDSMIVINTDGWVNNVEAIAYKARMIMELKPDLTVGLAEGNELDPICEKTDVSIVKTQVPKFIKARSREERKSLREYGYRKYLRNAIHKNFSLEKIRAENLLAARPEGGQFLGFLDEKGFLLGIGILENLNRTKKMLRAFTIVPTRNVAAIECGNIRLSNFGVELD